MVCRIAIELRNRTCEQARRNLWKQQYAEDDDRREREQNDADRAPALAGSVRSVQLHEPDREQRDRQPDQPGTKRLQYHAEPGRSRCRSDARRQARPWWIARSPPRPPV
jgi:hypothetical protein